MCANLGAAAKFDMDDYEKLEVEAAVARAKAVYLTRCVQKITVVSFYKT